MALFLVIVSFRSSGRSYYYCARAKDHLAACALVIGQREKDIVGSVAMTWPKAIKPLIAPEGIPHSFSLHSIAYAEKIVIAAGAEENCTAYAYPPPVPRETIPALMLENGQWAPTFTENLHRPGGSSRKQ